MGYAMAGTQAHLATQTTVAASDITVGDLIIDTTQGISRFLVTSTLVQGEKVLVVFEHGMFTRRYPLGQLVTVDR